VTACRLVRISAWLDPAKSLLSRHRLPPFAADRSRHRESFSYAPASPHRAGPSRGWARWAPHPSPST